MSAITLTSEDGAQVVVRVSGVPVRLLYDVVERLVRLPRTRAKFRELADLFAPFLVSWTYDQPPTTEGLMNLDFNLALAIVNGWKQGVATAPLPLLVRSSGGEPSEDPNPQS